MSYFLLQYFFFFNTLAVISSAFFSVVVYSSAVITACGVSLQSLQLIILVKKLQSLAEDNSIVVISIVRCELNGFYTA